MSTPSRHIVLVDFDGTASVTDVGGELLDHFASDTSWHVIDNDYINGRVGSRTAYRLAQGLLRYDRAEWLAFALERAQLDPGFSALAQLCQQRGWPLEILSDGLEFYIRAVLDQAGWDLPVRANRATANGSGLTIHTPHMSPLCGRCGTCKADRVLDLRQRGFQVTYVGDGYSDLCAAPRAHRVFAKGVLAERCDELGTQHHRFTTLTQVTEELSGTDTRPALTPGINT